MISRELVEKINALWHKQKTVGLSDAEKEEQKIARAEYLAAIRSQMRGMLDSIKFTDEDTSNHDHCNCDKCKH